MCLPIIFVSLTLVVVPTVKVNFDKIRDTALSSFTQKKVGPSSMSLWPAIL